MPALRGMLEPVFTICIGRFDDMKAWIEGKEGMTVAHLGSMVHAVAGS